MPTTPHVVLVTGASRGFGRLIAETLARKGYEVFATMRDPHGRNAQARQDFQQIAEREALALHTLELDVTDDASVERAVQAVLRECGHIDVLVNNAGFGVQDIAESVTLAQAQRQFDTNFFGILRLNRAALPAMRRQGSGLLLHVSSGGGRLAVPGMGLYCASKFAMEALAEIYRYELASLGIDSVIIEPGAHRTEIMDRLEPGEDPERKAGYGEARKIPDMILEKLRHTRANPQDIADAVLQIIETPAGKRKMRYRVGPGGPGVDRINALTDEIQKDMLEAFGLTHLTKFKRRLPPST
jgi:NAD(P)-dependent dehydrogenase (short-subunit alcohol dehydrogenase family)